MAQKRHSVQDISGRPDSGVQPMDLVNPLCYPCVRAETHPWHDNGEINWSDIWQWETTETEIDEEDPEQWISITNRT